MPVFSSPLPAATTKSISESFMASSRYLSGLSVPKLKLHIVAPMLSAYFMASIIPEVEPDSSSPPSALSTMIFTVLPPAIPATPLVLLLATMVPAIWVPCASSLPL